MLRRRTLRHPFEGRILDIRSRLRPEPFDWYPFDSFANLTQFEKLIPGGLDTLVRLADGEPVIDIGVADGDLAFLFESLGCRVTAIDWPGTNANQMRGIELLRRELGSLMNVREMDLDDQFRLDGERFGLAIALGLLYHLKNPFYFAEKLALHSRCAVFSTRILPRGTSQDAVARLTGQREFENDATNFWFFSEAGIERLFDRCGWQIMGKNITGDGIDDRYFCFAESRIAKSRPTIRLLDGWHAMENNAWRWTRREFGAVLENSPDGTRDATGFEIRFRITPELLNGPLDIDTEIDGFALERKTFTSPGDHVFRHTLPCRSLRHTVYLRLSRTFETDGRELGIIVRLPPNTLVDEETGMRLIA